MRENVESRRCTATYSRFMYLFGRQRFLNFHGQPGARLDRGRSIHSPAYSKAARSALFRIASSLMFFAPDLYRRARSKFWVDGLMHGNSWREFIASMNAEWQQLILLGTVILTANVAFLAIQSIDEATFNPDRSPAQIASYLSVMASIGSILTGLMLIRTNKGKSKLEAEDAAVFLNSSSGRRKLETLLVLYSLPFALLMWAVILFLVGFSTMCLNQSTVGVILPVGGVWLFVTVLVVWCFFTLAQWDKQFNAQDTAWDKLM
ncbi:hypothetical protein VNI00_018597 [Paramarasmius palmivorus]|uniref:Uncharacterized protein n=1 Tax=Paramarasmius palmivorus TaxID=297713 RepID=A0AAW0AWF6_9AGAR